MEQMSLNAHGNSRMRALPFYSSGCNSNVTLIKDDLTKSVQNRCIHHQIKYKVNLLVLGTKFNDAQDPSFL